MSGADSLEMIEVYHDRGLSVITLANSANGNPLNIDLLASLDNHFSQCLESRDTRVILLRSNGSPFCVGMDFAALSDGMDGPNAASLLRESIEAYSEVLARIYDGGKPVICLVDGEVRAGGVGLVCASDIVYATQRSQFSLSEVLFGLIPANVLPYLLGLRVSPQKARHLILTSKTATAEEALRYGMVDEVLVLDAMEKAVRTCVRQLLRSSPAALAAVKRFTGQNLWSSITELRKLAIEEQVDTIQAGDALSAVRAYRDGATPDWFTSFRPERPLFISDET
ncbi:MAG: hypothetical protein CMN78_03950 [Spirochaetales bacterium]|nr:hypothetical protein [Spirochaetales bacterium]